MAAPATFTEESITVSTTAVGFTAGTYDPGTGGVATGVVVTVETAAIRYWTSGTAPTATTGHVLEPGDVLELDRSEDIKNFKAIRRDGIDATIRVSYFR